MGYRQEPSRRDLLHDRLTFDLGNKKEINYHSWKERTKISTIKNVICKREILYTFVYRLEACN